MIPTVLGNGEEFKCGICGRSGGICGSATTQRVEADSKGKRALKTAGFIAASVLAVGFRKRRYADIELLQFECLRCGGVYIQGLGEEFEGWQVVSAEERAAFARLVGA